MQNQTKNFLIKDRILIVRRSQTRKNLEMPLLTVHSKEMSKEKMDSQCRLRNIFCERFKERKDINDILRIVEEIPTSECKIWKNQSQNKQDKLKDLLELRTKYKNNFKNFCSQSFVKQGEKLERNRIKNETYYIKIKQRLLKKLAKPEIAQENLKQTLFCKLMPYHSSSNLVKYNIKREFLSRRSLQRVKEKEKYRSLSRVLEKRQYRKIQEQQLEGWETNRKNKEEDGFNVCSFRSKQF